jgi:N-methylhydantoinase A
MVAFGGAGPLHAVAIAREIYIPTVIIPKMPGTFSALGMLMAPWRQDYARTLISGLDSLSPGEVEQIFAELNEAARLQLRADGIEPEAACFNYLADLRYVGQEHALSIPVDNAAHLTQQFAALEKSFSAEHERRYGQSASNESLELVKIRLVVTATKGEALAEDWLTAAWQPEPKVADQIRDVIFDDAARPRLARIVWRPSLAAGTEVMGPAVIEEPNSTILLHPGDRAVVSHSGHLVISVALLAQESQA